MLGPIVNAAAIVVCALAGAFFVRGIPARFEEILKKAIGLATIFIGIKGAFDNEPHERSQTEIYNIPFVWFVDTTTKLLNNLPYEFFVEVPAFVYHSCGLYRNIPWCRKPYSGTTCGKIYRNLPNAYALFCFS
jgi:hypothetical protein